MRILYFSTTFVWNIFRSEKNWARYNKKCILVFMYSTVILVRYWRILMFLDSFLKNTHISDFMKIRPVGAELFHSDGQREVTKLIVAFRNFVLTLRVSSCLWWRQCRGRNGSGMNHHHHHHHKHQGLGHLTRSVSRVTVALPTVSSVSQPFSFRVDCSGMILKGFGFVAFFAGVKASSFCIHLSCPVCIQSVVRGIWSRLFYGH
jgi:hypothetical protein